MLRIVVMVSGGGTNLQAILDAIDSGTITNAEVSVVISNNPGAYALKRAEKYGQIACLAGMPKGSGEDAVEMTAGQGVQAADPRFIHLLYVPTDVCSLRCSYCYLDHELLCGRNAEDPASAGGPDPLATLEYAVDKFREQNVIPFNISLHGGEVTCLPPEKFERLGRPGVPIHLSEITITAPNNDERGQAIQAVITRNLYRLWFSLKPMMGITWWNVVDDCGAPGEPSVSGLFSRDMEPKPAYFVLNDLINNQWKTRTCVKAGKDGSVEFRGFRGTYRLTWIDRSGAERSAEVVLH